MGAKENACLDLAPHYLAMVQNVLRAHVPAAEVWAYGSRVNGDAHDGSDLDLVVRNVQNPLERTAGLSRLRGAFSDSNIPIKVDVADWSLVPEQWRKSVLEAYAVVQAAESQKTTPDCNRRHTMAQEVKVIVYPVQDVEKAKRFYRAFLGVDPYVDSAYYVGYKTGDLEIGLDPHGKAGPIAYTDVPDIHAALQQLVQAGAEITQEPKEVAAGLLIAQLKDPAGNTLGLRGSS